MTTVEMHDLWKCVRFLQDCKKKYVSSLSSNIFLYVVRALYNEDFEYLKNGLLLCNETVGNSKTYFRVNREYV